MKLSHELWRAITEHMCTLTLGAVDGDLELFTKATIAARDTAAGESVAVPLSLEAELYLTRLIAEGIERAHEIGTLAQAGGIELDG